LDIRPRVFLRYFSRESLEFRGGARNEEEVEAFLCELDGVFFSQAVGGAGDDCPGAFLAIFAELGLIIIFLFYDRELNGVEKEGGSKRTLVPLSTNKLASNRT
jgi:hypothetical protein